MFASKEQACENLLSMPSIGHLRFALPGAREMVNQCMPLDAHGDSGCFYLWCSAYTVHLQNIFLVHDVLSEGGGDP